MPSPRSSRWIAAPAVLALATLVPALAPSSVGATSDLAGTAAPAVGSPGAQATPRPNLVFVMADDLGWGDLGSGVANGGDVNDFNETPRLDRLAAEGQSFTEAYASVQCSPTRTALHTGQYAVRPTNGIYAVSSIAGTANDPLRGAPESRRPNGLAALQTGYTTVGETLQQAGYATAYAGKFHVAATPEEIVASHGFDENWGGFNTGGPNNYFAVGGQFSPAVSPSLDQFAGDYTEAYVEENIAPYSTGVGEEQLTSLVGTDKHVTDAVTDATLDFIGRNKDEPFFAFVSQFAPHFPVNDAQARPDLLAKYRAKTPGDDPAKPSYGALVEGVDQSVARIVDYLEQTPDPRNGGKPLADNTLVIFTSDNGGEEDPVIAGADNGPLREDKGWPYEGAVRVPWIVWSGSPELVKGGGRTTRRWSTPPISTRRSRPTPRPRSRPTCRWTASTSDRPSVAARRSTGRTSTTCRATSGSAASCSPPRSPASARAGGSSTTTTPRPRSSSTTWSATSVRPPTWLRAARVWSSSSDDASSTGSTTPTRPWRPCARPRHGSWRTSPARCTPLAAPPPTEATPSS